MAVVLWSEATALSDIAGTALNGLQIGNTAILSDVDNTSALTARRLNCFFRINLGSISPTLAPSMTIRIFRKIGGVTPTRNATIFSSGESRVIAMVPTAGPCVYDSPVFILPGPFIFGVEIINNTNVTFAASGNSVIPYLWTEEMP